jgi:hypothetical protein
MLKSWPSSVGLNYEHVRLPKYRGNFKCLSNNKLIMNITCQKKLLNIPKDFLFEKCIFKISTFLQII